VTPSRKPEPGDVRESSRPKRPERILYEEATWSGTGCSVITPGGCSLGKGQKVPEVCKQLGISEQTYYRWRTKYGGMDPQMARQLQELQKENARLKRLVADQALDNQILREAARPKLVSPERRRRTIEMVRSRLGLAACRNGGSVGCWSVALDAAIRFVASRMMTAG